MKPDYGIDAPGVRRGMLTAGLAGAAVMASAAITALSASGTPRALAVLVVVLTAVVAAYGLGMAAYMTYRSRIGKLRTRERLLDLVGELEPWSGNELVLDVGCGRGLMMVGAARRLTTGKAVGIDMWRSEDQTDNVADAALENARREGVLGRTKVQTGDARSLPFAEASFDVVMSHWVVHNIPEPLDRTRALDEMLRVLKPGGVLVLADIAHHSDYQKYLVARGLSDIRALTGGLEAKIIGALSGGSFRPQALVGRRPKIGGR